MEDSQHGFRYQLSSRTGTKPVTKLLERGRLISTHHPHYLPSTNIPGYSGFFPGCNSGVGKSLTDNFSEFQNNKLEDTFRNGFRMKPAILSYCRKPSRYQHRKIPTKLKHVNYGRYQQIFGLYEKAQDHRDNYRDLTGTVAKVKRFHIPKGNREAWKPQYSLESYYLHHNSEPDTKVNFFNRFHPSHLYEPRPVLNYDSNPLKHILHGTQ